MYCSTSRANILDFSRSWKVVDSWFVTILATATGEEGKEYGSSVLREVQRIVRQSVFSQSFIFDSHFSQAAGDQTCVALNATSEKDVSHLSWMRLLFTDDKTLGGFLLKSGIQSRTHCEEDDALWNVD